MRETAKLPAAGARLKWVKRVGVVGFAFFLVKGLLWLGVLAGAWYLH